MQTSMKDIFKRIYIYLVLSVISMYVILSNMLTFPPSLLEALTFLSIFVLGILMYKRYPKFQNEIGIVTPKDRQILEITLYIYMGVFIFQALLNATSLSGLKAFCGIILLLDSIYGIYTLHNIIKK
jgi:hypothetical protein